jgi:hypothetical protein
MTDRISIPAPVANRGDVVEVCNYRLRGQVWERGRLLNFDGVCYTPDGADPTVGRWTYTVLLDRKSHAGNSIRLTVGSDRIRLAVKEADRG